MNRSVAPAPAGTSPPSAAVAAASSARTTVVPTATTRLPPVRARDTAGAAPPAPPPPRGPHRPPPPSAGAGARHGGRGLRRDLITLAVHAVVGDQRRGDRFEGADADVQRQRRPLDAGGGKRLQQLVGEVQPRGGRGNGS